MQALEQSSAASWRNDTSHLVLGEIFSSDASVVIWNRERNEAINRYFDNAFDSLGRGVNGVFTMDSLKQELSKMLPEHVGRDAAVEDIHLLSDMLTCLFDCEAVGLRLVPLNAAMCPSFHVDNIPVRLVNTYLGPGTQWLPLEALHPEPISGTNSEHAKTNFGMFYQKQHIQQMQAFDVALLKGKAWAEQAHLAAVHRSCPVDANDKRVLLTLDPM